MEITKKDFIRSLTDSITTSGPRGRLQPRDYEILRFMLEQKFCSLEAIYFRFFDVRTSADQALPNNLWTTRQRLSKLRALALIKTEKVLSSGRAHFLVTAYGHKVLTTHVAEVISIKPTKEIDFSLYEHDVRVTMIRALTETKGKCREWYSEKWLKACAIKIDGKYKFHFAKDLRPDAFFINSKGEKIALELEVSRKAKSRLEEKIRLYDELLADSFRQSGDRFKVFDKVWFIATKPVVARFLQKVIETRSWYPMSYRVDFYDHIVPETSRG